MHNSTLRAVSPTLLPRLWRKSAWLYFDLPLWAIENIDFSEVLISSSQITLTGGSNLILLTESFISLYEINFRGLLFLLRRDKKAVKVLTALVHILIEINEGLGISNIIFAYFIIIFIIIFSKYVAISAFRQCLYLLMWSSESRVSRRRRASLLLDYRILGSIKLWQ